MHGNLGAGLIDALSRRQQDKTGGDFQSSGQPDMGASLGKTQDTRLEMQRSLVPHLDRLSQSCLNRNRGAVFHPLQMKKGRPDNLVHECPDGVRRSGKPEKQGSAKPAEENGVTRPHIERTENHPPAGPDESFLQQIKLAWPHATGTYYDIERCSLEPIKGSLQIILHILDNPQALTLGQELPDKAPKQEMVRRYLQAWLKLSKGIDQFTAGAEKPDTGFSIRLDRRMAGCRQKRRMFGLKDSPGRNNHFTFGDLTSPGLDTGVPPPKGMGGNRHHVARCPTVFLRHHPQAACRDHAAGHDPAGRPFGHCDVPFPSRRNLTDDPEQSSGFSLIPAAGNYKAVTGGLIVTRQSGLCRQGRDNHPVHCLVDGHTLPRQQWVFACYDFYRGRKIESIYHAIAPCYEIFVASGSQQNMGRMRMHLFYMKP
jgi:hypothetical protein